MRIAVIGGGIAGLMAARSLASAGSEVVVLDKGRSPGGRLATRRVGPARLDHGAQFFTVRSDELARHVRDWERNGIVFEWSRGFGAAPDGYPRYAVHGGMNALAKHVAGGLDVRCSSLAFAVRRRSDGWDVVLDDASVVSADALVSTCPLPQSYSLLVSAEIEVPPSLWRTDYERTLALLAVLDGPSGLDPPGAVQRDGHVQFAADNALKGISDVPALTVHADATWSAARWDAPREDVHAALVELAQPYLGSARIVASEVKRWRFATPVAIWPEACWSPDDVPTIALAGDAFAGPRVEGAALSGLAAAARLLA